jgi:carnitine 3-dehydrogenase
MTEVRTVGLLGGGVIGAGWAARLLLNNIDVVVADNAAGTEAAIAEVMDNARRAYRNLTLCPPGAEGSLTIVQSVEAAAEAADFVQENLPEDQALKTALLGRASRAARPDVVIASSTSGLRPTALQADIAKPGRFVVGHPFNPVYLMPLVEICGGAGTSPDVPGRAADFYRSIGLHPLMLKTEIDGFIADRLMEALWREALHLINDDVATAAEIDDAIRFGPGLRWAFMGTFLTYRLAGGAAGMRHFLAQFGPALKLPWSKLEAPELTDDLIERLAGQSDDQAGGQSIRSLERLRDDCLVAVMQGLKRHDFGAGRALKQYEEILYERAHQTVMVQGDRIDAPLVLHQSRVAAEWVDYNGHMTESRYLQVFGDGTDALLRFVGIDSAYHAAGGSYYTVETHIMNLAEVSAGAPIEVRSQVLGVDDKRLHVLHALHHGNEGTQLATAEQMLVHVDTALGRAAPAELEVRDRLVAIAEAHSVLDIPDSVGRRITMPSAPKARP